MSLTYPQSASICPSKTQEVNTVCLMRLWGGQYEMMQAKSWEGCDYWLTTKDSKTSRTCTWRGSMNLFWGYLKLTVKFMVLVWVNSVNNTWCLCKTSHSIFAIISKLPHSITFLYLKIINLVHSMWLSCPQYACTVTWAANLDTAQENVCSLFFWYCRYIIV